MNKVIIKFSKLDPNLAWDIWTHILLLYFMLNNKQYLNNKYINYYSKLNW